MAFTRSLLIKALGGVAGVSGTTVGVLAGTGVFKKTEITKTNEADKKVDGSNKSSSKGETDSTQKQANDEDNLKQVDSEHRDNGETTTTTSPSAIPGTPENQGRNTNDDQERDGTTNQQDVGGSRGGTENLPSDTVPTASVKDVSLSNQGEGENGEASGNKEGASVGEVSKPQPSNDQPTNPPNPQSPGETATTTSPSANPGAGESQKQSTTDGADDQRRDGVPGGGNLPSNPDSQQEVSEGHNRSTDAPGEGAGDGDHGRVSQEEQKGQASKDSGETVDTKEDVSERQGTDSQDGQTGDPNNAQNGVQTSGDPSSSQITTGEGQVADGQQVNQDNGSDGSLVTPGLQSPEQPVSGGQNSLNTLPSTEGEGGNKEQQDSIQGGSGGQGSQQSEAENPTNPDSGADSHRAQTSDISQPSNSAPEAGQTGGDSVDSTPPGTSGTPGTGGTPGSTPSNEPGTGQDSTTEGTNISTTDTVTQTKEEKINAKLKTLNIPDGCNFSSESTSTTCKISEKELKKIKFEDSDDDDSSDDEVSGSEEKNIQLKIEILTGNKKTAYGLNDGDQEESDVTKDLLFTVSGFDNAINVGHDSTPLYPNTNPEFKVEDDELKLVWDPATNLAKKIGFEKGQDSTNYSLKTGTTTLKYSLDGTEANIKTLNSPNNSSGTTIYVSDNNNDYNQGVKVTFSANVTSSSSSEGSDSLEKGDYEIKYKDGDNGGWYLSKATKPAGGDQA